MRGELVARGTHEVVRVLLSYLLFHQDRAILDRIIYV